MNKILLVLTCVISLHSVVQAQELSRKNMYWENPYQYNPAYYGNAGTFLANFQSSVSGQNDDDNPRYSLLNVGGEVFDSFNLGITFSTERQGEFRNTFASLAYAYSFGGPSSRISLGMSVGYINTRVETLDFATNPYTNPNDPFLRDGDLEENRFSIGTGILYQWNELNASLGFPVLLQDGGELNPDFNLQLDYTFAVSYSVDVTPIFFAEVSDDGLEFFDINAKMTFNEVVWVLAGYRSESQLNAGIGLRKDFFGLGYTYSPALGDYREINPEMHEIMLSFSLGDKSFKQAEGFQKRRRSLRVRKN